MPPLPQFDRQSAAWSSACLMRSQPRTRAAFRTESPSYTLAGVAPGRKPYCGDQNSCSPSHRHGPRHSAWEGCRTTHLDQERSLGGGGGLGRCYHLQDLVLGRGVSCENLPTRSGEDHARVRESTKPDLRSMVSCRGLRQRAYSRRILCKMKPIALVRFASKRRSTTPPTSG